MSDTQDQDPIMVGVAHLQAGRLDDARQLFRAVLKRDPDHADAQHLLGLTAYHGGAWREAVKWINKAIAAQPDNPAYHSSLGLAFKAQGLLDEAATALRRALELYPDFADAHFNLGTVLNQDGKPGDAIRHFEIALRAMPEDAVTHFHLGNCYQGTGAARPAATHYRRAIALRPDFADAHYCLAGLSREVVGLDAALRHLRAAVAAAPDDALIHAALAVTLEQADRLDEARPMAERALALGPEEPDAHIAMASVDLRTGDAAAARRRLEALVEKPLADAVAAGAYHVLGQALGRLGDHAAAFAAQSQSQRFNRRDPAAATIDHQALPRTIAALRAWISQERFAAWDSQPPDDGLPPPIFLVGFPRSGTTLMEQILASHPNIGASGEEQFIYALIDALPRLLGRPAPYPECLDDLRDTDIRRLRAFYWEACRKTFGAEVMARRFLDKMPMNLIHLALIRRIFPDSPVIVALRDPRDVCLSCFMQRFTFNAAMIHFAALESTVSLYTAVMDLWHLYKACLGMAVIEYRYEDLTEDFQGMATRLLEFIGEGWDEGVRDYAATARANLVATPSYRDVTRPLNRIAVGRWRHYQAQMAAVLPALRPFVDAFGYDE